MRTNEDRNWEMIGAHLAAESSGKSPRVFSSRRTLFGIPSALDEEMAKLEGALGTGLSGECDSRTHLMSHSSEDESVTDSISDECDIRCVLLSHSPLNPVPNAPSVSSRHRVEHPLEPVFDDQSRVLILGTMPSPKSRETGFYYNHPQNRFWRVMAALFDEPLPQTNQEKEQLVLAHGIALWDVLAECTIEGAADGTIAECVPNDISWLLGRAPIEAIFCTGAKATELYQRHCEPVTEMPCTRLPSTSPANAGTSLEQLIQAYRVILDAL